MFIERLLGLQVTHSRYRRQDRFVGGVVDVPASRRSYQLFAAPSRSTPAELDAPGLWLARIEL